MGNGVKVRHRQMQKLVGELIFRSLGSKLNKCKNRVSNRLRYGCSDVTMLNSRIWGVRVRQMRKQVVERVFRRHYAELEARGNAGSKLDKCKNRFSNRLGNGVKVRQMLKLVGVRYSEVTMLNSRQGQS